MASAVSQHWPWLNGGAEWMLIVFYIEDEDLQGSQRREDNRGQWAGAWGGGGG